MLLAVILTFGAISGARFNPAVTLADALHGGFRWREVPVYVTAQVTGAIGGVAIANAMFAQPVFFASHHARHGLPVLFSEFVATFGLLAVIWGCSPQPPPHARPSGGFLTAPSREPGRDGRPVPAAFVFGAGWGADAIRAFCLPP